jgi:hypothetical protein
VVDREEGVELSRVEGATLMLARVVNERWSNPGLRWPGTVGIARIMRRLDPGGSWSAKTVQRRIADLRRMNLWTWQARGGAALKGKPLVVPPVLSTLANARSRRGPLAAVRAGGEVAADVVRSSSATEADALKEQKKTAATVAPAATAATRGKVIMLDESRAAFEAGLAKSRRRREVHGLRTARDVEIAWWAEVRERFPAMGERAFVGKDRGQARAYLREFLDQAEAMGLLVWVVERWAKLRELGKVRSDYPLWSAFYERRADLSMLRATDPGLETTASSAGSRFSAKAKVERTIASSRRLAEEPGAFEAVLRKIGASVDDDGPRLAGGERRRLEGRR